MESGLATGRVVWLVVRKDEPAHGDYHTSERQAALKVAWLRRQQVEAQVVRAIVTPATSNPPPTPSAPPSDLPHGA